MKKLIFVAILVFPSSSFAQPKLVSNKITLKSGKSFNLNLAEGFEMLPAAEGLKRVRFFAKAPDGRVFVTDMYNLADNKWFTRLAVSEIIVKKMESLDLHYPQVTAEHQAELAEAKKMLEAE